MPIRWSVINHSDESYIYLAAGMCVDVKAMDVTDWELYNEDLPNCMVFELEVVNGSNTLRAATWGRGVWEYSLKDRNDYPAIVHTTITDPPTYTVPAEESEQYVTSKIGYDLVLVGAEVLWSIDEPTFENSIAMENTEDSTWVSVDPLPDFPAGTKVFFKVVATGLFDQVTETYKFMYTVKPYEYCESFGNMSWETSVTLVDFSELNNPSGKPSPYSSYIDLDTATVYRTMPYDLSVNLNTDGGYTIHSRAWIDWNRDGDFEDLGEDYDLGTAFGTEDGPTTLSPLSITIPGDAHLGKTTMRVSAKYNSDPDPCETGFDGEVEDYTVFIKPVIDLDFEIEETDICQGEEVHFEYTGTPLEVISWTFTNGIDTYTSDDFTDDIVFESAGDYSLTLVGYEGEMTDGGTWPSIIHVHPIYHDTVEASICDGDELIFGTQTLTESGEYIEPFTSEFGCDSTVTMFLELMEVDVTVASTDFELTANESAATWQWLDCNSEWAIVDGATDQTYVPLENGSFAVIVDDGECVDTSDCYDIVALTLVENNNGRITVYPNPNSGNFVINLNQEEMNELKVYAVSGQLIHQESVEGRKEVAMNLEVAPGIYYVALYGAENEKIMLKLVIE